MAQAQGSRHSLAHVAEVTYGTTPGTPTMLETKNTGVTIAATKDSFISEEIRNDRQITDLRHGLMQVSGDINFEAQYGAYDDLLEGALFGTWSTNELKAGVVENFYTFERAFNDISEFHIYTGCMINSMNLSIIPNGMVTGTFGVIGKTVTVSATALDAGVTAATTHPPFDGFTGSLTEAGGALDAVTSLTIDVQNNLTGAFAIGNTSAISLNPGRSIVTGTMGAFFETEALLNKFLNETESAIIVTLEGISGGDHVITLPRIKYTEGSVDVTSADDGLIVNLPFQAIRDSTEATNIVLDRVPA